MSLGRNEFPLCVLLYLFGEFSIRINKALMRREMAADFTVGMGAKSSGLWSLQNMGAGEDQDGHFTSLVPSDAK